MTDNTVDTVQRLRFVWTVLTAEGDTGRQLEQAQARAIKEILQWQVEQPHRSPQKPSEATPGPNAVSG